MLDERLALQVLRTVPGFELLTELMLRDCGVTDTSNLQVAALRALTLEPGAVVAEEGKPADAILIIKRGGLVVTSRPLNPHQDARPRLIRERDVFGTAATIVGSVYRETAAAAEVGPARYCSPRRMTPFIGRHRPSRDEGSPRDSMTWRAKAISACL